MTKDEALKLALDALETLDRVVLGTQRAEDAITAIKEALAKPEQEPVACIAEVSTFDGYLKKEVAWNKRIDSFPVGTKFYTTPPQRKPLTDEQADKVIEQVEDIVGSTPYAWDIVPPRSLVRAILKAAHGIKE